MELFEAARDNKADEVARLISSGIKATTKLFNDETALHWAAIAGSCDAARVLLEKGARVNAQTKYFRETPLHLAIQEKKSEMISLLLDHGANPDIRNHEGENCVFLAIRWCDVDILGKLLDAGANPNLYNKEAASPLHICVDFLAYDAARVLLMKGADPNYQNNKGQTPFHVACVRREVMLAQIFYESGADPDVRDAELRTAWKCCDDDFKAKVLQEVPDDPIVEPAAKIPEQDSRQWLIDGKCFMCKNLVADKVVLPCRHKVLCEQCSSQFFEQYGSCPQCYMAVFAAVKE